MMSIVVEAAATSDVIEMIVFSMLNVPTVLDENAESATIVFFPNAFPPPPRRPIVLNAHCCGNREGKKICVKNPSLITISLSPPLGDTRCRQNSSYQHDTPV